MIGTRKNLIADAKAQFDLRVRLLDPDKNPIEATGMTGEFLITNDRDEQQLQTSEAGAADGEFHFHLSTADVSNLPARTYNYQVDLIGTDGERSRALFGDFNVRSPR